MKLFLIIILGIILSTMFSCKITSENYSQVTFIDQSMNIEIVAKTYPIDSLNGYGYMIFYNNQKLIDQKIIPAIEGNKVFKSKKDAYLCAKLVAEKLFDGNMLPSVNQKDLDSLQINTK